MTDTPDPVGELIEKAQQAFDDATTHGAQMTGWQVTSHVKIVHAALSALQGQVKELENHVRWLEGNLACEKTITKSLERSQKRTEETAGRLGDLTRRQRHENYDKDATIATLRDALEAERDEHKTVVDFYERNGPQWTSPEGNEYESTSCVIVRSQERIGVISDVLTPLAPEPNTPEKEET